MRADSVAVRVLVADAVGRVPASASWRPAALFVVANADAKTGPGENDANESKRSRSLICSSYLKNS